MHCRQRTGVSRLDCKEIDMSGKSFVFFSIVFFLSGIPALLYAEDNSLKKANRQTAVRYLKLCESCIESEDFEGALSNASLGIAYDSSVADLWYMEAAAKTALGFPKADALSLVAHALAGEEWVDYNRDGARILYADILCDTGKYSAAIETLDSAPFIHSSDAEFIRAKASYRMRTAAGIQTARGKIDAARKIYPEDSRFPRLFFKQEYALRRMNHRAAGTNAALVQEIAGTFIARMPSYDAPDAELEIYAALFASGEKQTRMLNAFAAHGMSHPLYAVAALKAGIASQQEAWDYFCEFADTMIPLEDLNDMLSLITKRETIASVKIHLDSYNGLITQDTDGDGEPNMTVQYARGRPQLVAWDKEHDGVIEWRAECDFGVPLNVAVPTENLQLIYGTFPYAVQVIFKADVQKAGFAKKFNLLNETFKWTPFEMQALPAAKKLAGTVFFVPRVLEKTSAVEWKNLLAVCSSYEVPSAERDGALIHFSVLDGVRQTADYRCGGKVYARTLFDKGIPYMRSVDNNGDGIFETTETFGYAPKKRAASGGIDDSSALTETLFGMAEENPGIYLKMIQIDTNADTVIDFTEEYHPFGGKTSSWDNDGDGEWNVRYKRYPHEPLMEDALFYQHPEHKLVTITSMNGQPVKVISGSDELHVSHGEGELFFWLGDGGGGDNEHFIMEHFERKNEQGVCEILQRGATRMLAVRIGKNIYARVLSAASSGEKEKADETRKAQ